MRDDADGAPAQQRGEPGRVAGPTISIERTQPCQECGAPLAADQRYCLVCGARAGAPSPQLQGLLARLAASGVGATAAAAGGAAGAPAAVSAPPEAVSSAPAAASTPPAAVSTAPAGGLRLPPPRVAALLVLVFLAFGLLMGHVARSRVSDEQASARSPLKVVLPASGTLDGQTASSPTSSGSEPTSQAPAVSEPEATPAAPPAKPAASTTAPSTGGPKGSAGNSEEEGGAHAHEGGVPAGTPDTKLPAIKHVFVIMLSDEPYASVFGPASTASYLTGKLVHEGELLPAFHAVAHEQLADELALVSGQGPTMETAANCPTYREIQATGSGPDEAVLGSGCVYPPTTKTLPGQLEAKRLSWRAYIQGIDEAGATAGACAHPALGTGDPSSNQSASTGPYATFRNPFVYLGAIVGAPACQADDVGLSRLVGDLANPKRTPAFSYIAPDRCHDGNPTPCTPGAPAGVADVDSFLAQVVPEITASKAYKENGLLVITTDEAPSSGVLAESSSCCGEPLFPNDPAKTLTGAPQGGGVVGALLLSPFVKAGSTGSEQYNDFSLLKTVEQLFSLSDLGYAALSAVKPLEPSLFVTR